ncbi:MAG: hypothetical protein AB1567_06935 [bacterium]
MINWNTENKTIEILKPDKEILEIIRVVIEQNYIIIKALANPMLIAKNKEEEK